MLSKSVGTCAVALLFSACGVKTYNDLKVNSDNGAKVIETIGKPDAVETMPDNASMQLWHYYDLALDLEMRNDTLQAIVEASGMAPVGGKMDAAEEAAH